MGLNALYFSAIVGDRPLCLGQPVMLVRQRLQGIRLLPLLGFLKRRNDGYKIFHEARSILRQQFLHSFQFLRPYD